MFMDEFANTIRQQAAVAMRTMFHETPNTMGDPLLELIVCLLEDGAGGILSPLNPPVTTEQWLNWNRLATERPRAASQMLTRVLERERVPLPSELEAMRQWAAQVLLSTLDRLETL